MELGYRGGHRRHGVTSDSLKTDVQALQASLLGVLALLLGFTFSLALQRYDNRHQAVIDEANAIGTAYLRSQLLPASVRAESQSLLHRLVDLRARSAEIPLDHDNQRQLLLAEANATLDALWARARRAAAEEPNPVTTGLFIQALNDAIDAYGRRDAALTRHVPELILLLLVVAFIAAGWVFGYAAGVSGHRPSRISYILVGMIVMLFFIIIDLDRPRRGLITVDHSSLNALKSAIDRAQASMDPSRAGSIDAARPAVTGRP